jgi:chromosome segregation ATPase
MSEIATIAVAVGSALMGGGGVAAWIRAQGQNRVDLFSAQAERIAKLEARSDDQDRRNDELARQNAELLGTVGGLKAERDAMTRRLEAQDALIAELQTRVARLGSLEEENARLRQLLQIEQAKREFLEREVNALRQEIAQLQARLSPQETAAHAVP